MNNRSYFQTIGNQSLGSTIDQSYLMNYLMTQQQQLPYQQPLIINGPVQKHTPMFFGQQRPPQQLFTPIIQQQKPTYVDRVRMDDYHNYPYRQISVEKDNQYRQDMLDQWVPQRIQLPEYMQPKPYGSQPNINVNKSQDANIFTNRNKQPPYIQQMPKEQQRYQQPQRPPPNMQQQSAPPQSRMPPLQVNTQPPQQKYLAPPKKEETEEEEEDDEEIEESEVSEEEEEVQVRKDVKPAAQKQLIQSKPQQKPIPQEEQKPKQPVQQPQKVQQPVQAKKQEPITPQPQQTVEPQKVVQKVQQPVPQQATPVNKQVIQQKTTQQPVSVLKNAKKVNPAKRNLRIFFIRFSFIVFYFSAIRTIILARKRKFYLESTDSISKAFHQCTEWALTFLESFLMQFWKTKDKYDWIIETKLSDKEKSQRAARCMIFLDKLFDKLIEFAKESNFGKDLLIFMADISQNYQFPPQNFYFPFEIQRLSFTSFAALKGMTKNRQKMVIANFVIIRIVGFTILYSPWQIGLEGVKQTALLQENCTILTSILHELIISEQEEMCKVVKNNQVHLAVENRIVARTQGPLKYEQDPQDPAEKKRLRAMEKPMIFPVYNAGEMELIFNKEVKWVDAIKDKIDEFLERMVKIVGDVLYQEKRSIREKRMADRLAQLRKL